MLYIPYTGTKDGIFQPNSQNKCSGKEGQSIQNAAIGERKIETPVTELAKASLCHGVSHVREHQLHKYFQDVVSGPGAWLKSPVS